MGIDFSSQQLPGAVVRVAPAVSFAYAENNGNYFGVDARLEPHDNADIYGECTPYLVQTVGTTSTTATCLVMTLRVPNQSLDCPVVGRSLLPGQITVSFTQYLSTTSIDGRGNTVTFRTHDEPFGIGEMTFSIVKPTSTVIITTTASTTSTITSGISERLASTTVTVPQPLTVTVYQKTIVSTQTSLSTLTGVNNTVTVTGTCPSKPTSTCIRDNCLRALVGKSANAVSFCSKYIKTSGLATPTYASQCAGVTSRVSSACLCIVTPAAPARALARGNQQFTIGPPDFTYRSGGASPSTVTVFSPPLVTVTVPVPSSTLTDPDSTITSGTSTSTDIEPSTVTVTVLTSDVDSRTAVTTTVAPTICA
ncbi:hypothetical protein BP5796_10284 [Coleophoma crateriformis]|uniref:Uncharacterized protein n=1 Tax=Coleophoma crateriformis TaxID=565419 RepID=A0A3D8QUZ5_9HELO|nr:hypothetical protein BP5796_10284 [Coleophoma crateriformis]